MKDITSQNFNGSTYDKVATIGTITATDRAGVSRVAGTSIVGAIPKGAVITATYLSVVEAFDGTTPKVSVGIEGTLTKYFPSTTVGAVAFTKGTLGLDKLTPVMTPLLMTTTASNSTVGKVEVIIEYIDTENRREMFTV